MRYMLVDGQGNFGSVDGDPPAAMRYTECRMSKLAGELLADIDKETVDWQPNYDDKELEPTVLPTKVPNLLINGAHRHRGRHGDQHPAAQPRRGHRRHARADRRTRSCSDDELIKLIPGPDFPTGGVIQGRVGILSAYKTGRGTIVVRGVAHVEEIRKDRPAIIVTELPFMVNKARWIEADRRAWSATRSSRASPTSATRSDRTGIRVVFELKRDADDKVVLDNLFKYTSLQTLVLGQHARDRRRPAGAADAAPRAAGVHRSPPRGRHPPHAVRSARGAARAARSSRASASPSSTSIA